MYCDHSIWNCQKTIVWPCAALRHRSYKEICTFKIGKILVWDKIFFSSKIKGINEKFVIFDVWLMNYLKKKELIYSVRSKKQVSNWAQSTLNSALTNLATRTFCIHEVPICQIKGRLRATIFKLDETVHLILLCYFGNSTRCAMSAENKMVTHNRPLVKLTGYINFLQM